MGRKLTVSDLLQDVRRKVTDFIMESFLPSPTEPTILPLSDTFLPYVTVRSGGVSLRALKELLFARTMKSVDSLLELETANTRDRKIAVASLERLIGEISATSPVRNELIHLKRDVFNDRLTSTALSIDAESEMTRRLSIEESSSLLEWFDKRAQREETEIEARTAFTEELSRNSAKLRKLCQRPNFRIALNMASPDLSYDVNLYCESPSRFSTGKTARLDRSLIRYYTRSAVKLSPFSSFMRTRIIKMANVSSPSNELLPKRSILRRSVRLNRCIPAYFAHKITEHTEFGNSVPVFLNRAVVRNGDRLYILRLRRDLSQASRIRVPSESIASLRNSTALGYVFEYFAGRKKVEVTLSRMIADLAATLGGRTAASAFIHRLVDIGLLLHKLPLPQDDSSIVTALADRIADLPSSDERLQQVKTELRRMRCLEIELEHASTVQRSDSLAALNVAVQNTHRALDDTHAPDWTNRLVSEEVSNW